MDTILEFLPGNFLELPDFLCAVGKGIRLHPGHQLVTRLRFFNQIEIIVPLLPVIGTVGNIGDHPEAGIGKSIAYQIVDLACECR